MRLTTYEQKIIVERADELIQLLGSSERHVDMIEEALSLEVFSRGEEIIFIGKDEKRVQDAVEMFEQLIRVIRRKIPIDTRDIASALEMTKNGNVDQIFDLYEEEVARTQKGRIIRAKTLGQRDYVRAMKKHDLVFGIGPAGTGKMQQQINTYHQTLNSSA